MAESSQLGPTLDHAPLRVSNPDGWLRGAITAQVLAPQGTYVSSVVSTPDAAPVALGAIGVMAKPSRPTAQVADIPRVQPRVLGSPQAPTDLVTEAAGDGEIGRLLSGLRKIDSTFQVSAPIRKRPGVNMEIAWFAHDIAVSDDAVVIITPLAYTTLPKMVTGVIRVSGCEYKVVWLNLIGEFTSHITRATFKVVTFVRTT